MDAGERPDEDRLAAHVAGLHRGVLAGRTLAVVLVADREPRDPGVLVPLGEFGQRHVGTVAHVDAGPGRLERERVVRADEQVAGDVREVAAELQPRTGRRDVVGGALAGGLHQHPQAGEVLPVPRGERLERLEAVRTLADRDVHTGAVGGRRDEPGLARVEAALGQLVGGRCLEQDLGAVVAHDRFTREVDVEATRERHGDHGLRRPDERERSGVAVVALREVAVERRDDRVHLARLDVVALPLTDARAAGVREHGRADRLEVGEEAVALDGGAHLLRTRRDEERGLHAQAPGRGLPGEVRGPTDVLVGGVRAGTDEGRRDGLGVTLLGDRLAHLGDRTVEVGGVRTDEVRHERVEVDLDDAVVVALGVGVDLGVVAQRGHVRLGERGDAVTTGGPQVRGHLVVELEQRARGTDLGAHVADRGLAGGGDARCTGTEVLDDRARAALHREDAGDLEDDVLRRGPAGERSHEAHADVLRHLGVERPARHDVDGVRATDADRDHAETARVRRVGVGAHHHPAGERVVLEHDLVDDARARLPEPDAVLGTHGAEEVVDLGVLIVGDREIGDRADAGLDEVVAVDRARHRGGRQLGQHELQQRHLRGGVLHRHAVGAVVAVVLTAPRADRRHVIGVGEHHLLAERERPAEALTDHGEPLGEALVHPLDECGGGGRADGLCGHLGLRRGSGGDPPMVPTRVGADGSRARAAQAAGSAPTTTDSDSPVAGGSRPTEWSTPKYHPTTAIPSASMRMREAT